MNAVERSALASIDLTTVNTAPSNTEVVQPVRQDPLAIDPDNSTKDLVVYVGEQSTGWAEHINNMRNDSALRRLGTCRAQRDSEQTHRHQRCPRSSELEDPYDKMINTIISNPPPMLDERKKDLELLLKLLHELSEKDGGSLSLVDLPRKLDAMRSEVSDPQSHVRIQPFRLFYAMWYKWLGPPLDDPIIPATPYKQGFEGQHFRVLFPHDRGFYDAAKHSSIMDDYIVYRLQIADKRFQKHKKWLLWTLTKTQNAEVAALVNLLLITLHGVKARHLGSGGVQCLELLENFEPSVWDEEEKVLVKRRPSHASEFGPREDEA